MIQSPQLTEILSSRLEGGFGLEAHSSETHVHIALNSRFLCRITHQGRQAIRVLVFQVLAQLVVLEAVGER